MVVLGSIDLAPFVRCIGKPHVIETEASKTRKTRARSQRERSKQQQLFQMSYRDTQIVAVTINYASYRGAEYSRLRSESLLEWKRQRRKNMHAYNKGLGMLMLTKVGKKRGFIYNCTYTSMSMKKRM